MKIVEENQVVFRLDGDDIFYHDMIDWLNENTRIYEINKVEEGIKGSAGYVIERFSGIEVRLSHNDDITKFKNAWSKKE